MYKCIRVYIYNMNHISNNDSNDDNNNNNNSIIL